MNILYGVQATGNGHISRSREIIRALRETNTVDVIFSGREEYKLVDVESFRPYSVFKGLTYKTKKGNIDYIDTVANLDLFEFSKNIEEYSKPHDLVISDFEPISCRIAERLDIPSVGIAHQYNLTDDFLPQLVVNSFAPVDIEIGINWWHFNKSIIPPILPQLHGEKTVENKIVVYLPWNDIDVYESLTEYDDYTFICYDPRFDKVEIRKSNVTINPPNRENFLKDVQSCEGVLSNAGFQLASEVIFLGKKLFVIPLQGQFEQELNAKNLQALNLGMYDITIKSSLFSFWLKKKSINTIAWNPRSLEILTQWINAGCVDVGSLIKSVW